MLATLASRKPATARAAIGVLLGLLLAGIFIGWEALRNAETQQIEARLQLESDALAQLIEARFHHQAATLHRLAARWPLHRERQGLWQRDVANLLRDFQNFQAIEWLDADYRMRWIEPLAGNESVVDFSYQPSHPNFPLLEQVRKSGEPALSNSFELQQGGMGLAYYVPLYRDEERQHFDGFLLGIFRVEVLVDDLLRNLPRQRLSLEIREGDRLLFSRPTADMLSHRWTVTSSVHLGSNSNFSITAYPTRSLIDGSSTTLPLIILITGVLAALSLCYALWLALLSAQRLNALSISNRKLQIEFARRQATESSLQQNQARLKLILDMTDHSHDALFILGLKPLELIYINRTCWLELGYNEDELRSLLEIAPQDVVPDLKAWSAAIRELSVSRGSIILQQQVRVRSGQMLPMEVSMRYLERHGRGYLICVGRNNSAQLQIAARLEQLSQQDGLTGLFNRRYFDKTVTAEWRKLRRMDLPLGLLMLDVDHFKRYNDSLGHQAGDAALRALADALQENLLREGDCACRYGGEEFVVILPGADINECVRIAGRLHEAVRKLNLPHPDSPEGRLTISIGAASILPSAELSPHDLVAQADGALYLAKSQGRNRTCSTS
ncbi:diguanylate cyclase [Pseudomonas sp.]|uniref:diguanylate cyclase n=1 Tax=Pseudomonas sp. TaxID=306 RepID=UPI00272C78BF|nr:diguanylate cyclase [Pseudomonas sp.]